MMSTLLLLTCAGLPTWLTTPSPGEALRWSPAAVERPSAGVLRVLVGPVPALRFDGSFGDGCELRADLLSGRGALEVRQPLVLLSSPGHRHLVLPGWVTSQGDAPARVEVSGCVQDVVTWQARLEPLEYALASVAEELRTMARAGPPPKFAEEASPFLAAHRWQREAVWALDFPAALESLPGPSEAVRALREALVERVILEARADDPTFGESHPVEAASPGRRLGSENGVWRLIRPAAEVVAPVDGEVLHLFTRVSGPAGATGWRVEARFDEGPTVVLSGLAGADPDVPGMSHQCSEVLLMPAGARQLHLRTVSGEVWWRAYVSQRRPHVEDLLAGRGPRAALLRAEALPGEAPRTRLVRAWARALRGDTAALREARTLAKNQPRLEAWLAVVAAELAPDADSSRALAEAWPLVRASGAACLESRLVRLELQQGLREHHEAEVLEARAAHFRAQLPTLEAALEFAEFEAQAPPELESAAPRALEILDALGARFPLDRRLETVRRRTFSLATSWSHLGPGLASAQPEDEGTIEALESDAVRSPGRALLGRVPTDGTPLALEIPRALLPGRLVTVDCFVERGATLPRALAVRFDERAISFPALQRRGHFSVGLAAGTHHVSLSRGEGAGALWCGWAVAPTARVRRYLAAEPQRPVSFLLPSGAVLAQLTVRRQQGDAAPFELTWQEPGAPESRLTLRGVTSPDEGAVSVLLPLHGRAGPLRLTSSAAVSVRLALRQRRPRRGEADDGGSVRGGGMGALTIEPGAGDEVEARLQRAATLLELDEVALAREDLLAAAEATDSATPSRERAARWRSLLRHLWRTADELAGAAASSVPDDGALLEVPVSLARSEPSLSVGLIELADDEAFLRSASAEQLRKRAGSGADGDLALWLAASCATREGAFERAANLWVALARSRPEDALVRRAAGEALLLDDTANHAALAVVELEAALRLRPLDALARRLLKRALGRTRLRVARLADSSAGVLRVKGAADTWDDPLEASLLGEGDGEVVTRGRPATFTVEGLQPHQLVVRARLVELRPHASAAGEAVALELTLDEQPLARLSCLGGCRSAPLDIPAGAHRLGARLVGGVRPAARVKLEGATGATPLAHPSADFFVARPGEPLVLTVQVPASARLELRSRVDRQGATTARVDAADVGETVTLDGSVEPGTSLEGGTPVSGPRLVSLSLDGTGPRVLRVTPARGEVLVRVLLREPAQFSPREDELAPPFASSGVERPLVSASPRDCVPRASGRTDQESLDSARDERDGCAVSFEPVSLGENGNGVAPGLEGLGSLELVTSLDRRVESRDGADVPPAWSWSLGGAWRRRIDEAFLTVKGGGQLRLRQQGQPVGKLSGEAFFLHPDLRFLRGHLQLDGLAQRVGVQTAIAGRAQLMLEPVVTLRPGLSLVTKVGVWLSGRSLRDVDNAQLPEVDPDLFSRFDVAHPRGLFFEAGLQWMPFANVVLFGNTRLTTNPSMSPFDQDHVSATFLARALWGRVFTQVQVRGLWFSVDDSRPDPVAHATIYGSVFSTWWINPNLHLEAGVWASARFGTDLVQASVYFAWEGSNGRRFRDHTPLEGEDSFFPQRGPPREVADLEVPR